MNPKTIQEKLTETQKGCLVRRLTVEEVQKAIEEAELQVMSVPKALRHTVKLEYIPFWVAKAYSYPAEGTGITASFNNRGKAVNIQIGRLKVSDQPKCRLVMDYGKLRELIEAETGIKNSDKGFSFVLEVIRHAAGFNQHLTKLF